MTHLERQKSIAVAFVSAISFKQKPRIEEQYDAWTLTEEGKRLTAEEPVEDNPIEYQQRLQPSKPEEPAINVLIKISKQLDRIEGSMKFEPKE